MSNKQKPNVHKSKKEKTHGGVETSGRDEAEPAGEETFGGDKAERARVETCGKDEARPAGVESSGSCCWGMGTWEWTRSAP